MSADTFFAELPAFDDFAQAAEPAHYQPVPEDWVVVITDVRDSTKAVAAGAYKDVNALGVVSIVALRNAVDAPIPFVFGGDGATALVPGRALEAVERALRGLVALGRDAFGLDLRASRVPVAELRGAGHDVRVARYRASPDAAYAMLAGTGPDVAERWVKDPERGAAYQVGDGEADADFTGFECRWRPIPSRKGKVLALLVRAEEARAYGPILQALGEILDDDAGNPLSTTTLRLHTPFAAFSQEARILCGDASGPAYRRAQAEVRLRAGLGAVALVSGTRMGSFDGATYRAEVVRNSDFRKLDGTLRMVLDVSEAQHRAILDLLEAGRREGSLCFGAHLSDSALMTCAVGATYADHLHFIDGADGGYTRAAVQLKAQLAEI